MFIKPIRLLFTFVKVVVFTHCGIGLGTTSLQNTIINLKAKNASKKATTSNSSSSTSPQFLLNDLTNENSPYKNLNKLSLICIGSTSDPYFQYAIDLYQQFLEISKQNGQLFIAHTESDNTKLMRSTYNGNDANASLTSLQWKNEIIPNLINNMCEVNYKPFEAILNCGEYHKLESPILIWPNPMVSIFLLSLNY